MDRLYDFYEKYRKMAAEKGLGKCMAGILRAAAVVSVCYGWWGVIYPELTLLPSTYEIVYDGTGDGRETKATAETVQKSRDVIKWNFDNQIYWTILDADPEQIQWKSRIADFFKNNTD